MGAKAASETWVGRPLPRLEDEALLRGDGRFIDDLDPVANARHAAVLRSPYAHARIARLDPTAAVDLPGVVGVLTGDDVVVEVCRFLAFDNVAEGMRALAWQGQGAELASCAGR